ncbi:Uncharacterised protein [Mycobacteroides abscessus subsp. abscessus]|nr:Uncharacterised protein [Mycobacteroides abscessus subsp. abscessus]
MVIGYACVTPDDEQTSVAQQIGLEALGVTPDRMYIDHVSPDRHSSLAWRRSLAHGGLNFWLFRYRRPALKAALATYRAGDKFAITDLDQLADTIPAARRIAATLTAHGIHLVISPG